MSLTLCFLERDILAKPRRRGFYLRRVGFVALGALVILWGTGLGGLSGSTTVGLQIFQSLSSTILFAVCVLSAFTAGLTVVREKTDGSLGLLLLTDMSCRHQVVGRLLAGTFSMLVLAFSSLPLFSLAGTLGGISPLQIGAAFLVLAGTIFLGGCIGLFCASLAGTEREFTGLGILLGLGVFAGLPVLVSLWGAASNRATEQVLNVVSPFAAMHALCRGSPVASGARSCLAAMLMGLPFLWLSWRLLPRRLLAEARLRVVAGRLLQAVTRRRHAARPPISGNPVAWRDRNFLHGGIGHEWKLSGLLTLPAVGGVTCIIALATHAGAKIAAIATCTVIALTAGLVFMVGTVVRAARVFNTEKLNRTLELLLVTGLEEKEIVGGKIRAVALSSLPWLVFAVAGGLMAVIIGGDARAILVVAAWAAGALGTVFFLASVAFFLSMRFKTPGVLGLCFLVFVVWNWFGKSLLMLLFMAAGAVSGAMTGGKSFGAVLIVMAYVGNTVGDVVVGLLFLRLLHRNFRRQALKEI